MSGGARVLLTGASGFVGRRVADGLVGRGAQVLALSRRRAPDWPAEARWLKTDLALAADVDAAGEAAGRGATLIHVAPLPLVRRLLPLINEGRVTRVVAVGTTSRYTKLGSTQAAEQRMVAEQEAAERALISACSDARIPWTLLRPTLVYDGLNDRNVAFIIRCIRRFGFFPMVGDGVGLRQPLHVDDLAKACVDVMQNPATYGRDYNLAGGQTLPYHGMVEFIFAVMDRDTRIVKVPTLLLEAMLHVLRLVPRYRYLNSAMIERMNEDLVFDYSSAARDFGFKPRRFLAAEPRK